MTIFEKKLLPEKENFSRIVFFFVFNQIKHINRQHIIRQLFMASPMVYELLDFEEIKKQWFFYLSFPLIVKIFCCCKYDNSFTNFTMQIIWKLNLVQKKLKTWFKTRLNQVFEFENSIFSSFRVFEFSIFSSFFEFEFEFELRNSNSNLKLEKKCVPMYEDI